nr:MAG TPA: hypothetical protein [Caudoviricetes sp.]
MIVFILLLVIFSLNSFILSIQNIIESGHFCTGFILNQALYISSIDLGSELSAKNSSAFFQIFSDFRKFIISEFVISVLYKISSKKSSELYL